MAVTGQITLNGIQIYQVDADPATTAGGLVAPRGSIALFDDTGIFIKTTDSTTATNWAKLARNQIRRGVAQVAHGFSIGQAVYFTGSTWALARADSPSTSNNAFLICDVPSTDTFVVLVRGYITGLSGLTAGTTYYLSASSAGALTATAPALPVPMLFADSTTSGFAKVGEFPLHYAQEISGTSTVTSTTGTDALITGMTITPPSGTYLVTFSGSFSYGAGGANTQQIAIYVANTLKADSLRQAVTTANTTKFQVMATNGQVTVNGSQAIEIWWSGSQSGQTLTVINRTMNILRVGN